jgi:hypothetical protein
MGPVLTKRYVGIPLGLLFWMITAWANAAMSPAAALLEGERGWWDQAAILVQIAESGRAEALPFNKDVRELRAQLRKHIQQARNVEISPVHQQLHSTMLIMDVLLKSAAACQAASKIVCPPLLMIQLKTVLNNAYSKLDEIEEASNNFNADGIV